MALELLIIFWVSFLVFVILGYRILGKNDKK